MEDREERKPLILAHRGYSKLFTENTLEAFVRASEVYADGFEMDLRLTKDKKIAITHDAILDRISGSEGSVKGFTSEQLKNIKIGSRASMPLLEDIWDWLTNTNLWINLELKEREVVPHLVKLLRSRPYEKLICSSFLHSAVYELKAKLPEIRIGLLLEKRWPKNWEEFLNLAKERGVYSLHLPIGLIAISGKKKLLYLIESAKSCGFKVALWTVDDPDLYLLFKDKVDMIITNDPISLVSSELYEAFRGKKI
ncbi:MAG: glycerophosphoryl diester phosphodiesterase [Thermotogota bacterium]|nr:glycerophosphoryl diester phosphodiesterase [Thermotogota bacterium]MDK2865297.1 glycerophosphoryl diester phosphodiesterase [Thermotogota bacterium]